MTLKYDPRGRRLWAKTWNGLGDAEDAGSAITVAAGGVYVAGYSVNCATGLDTLVLKYGPGGGFKWSQSVSSLGLRHDFYSDMARCPNGDVVMAGESAGHLLVTRLSPTAVTRWSHEYDDPVNTSESGTYVGVGSSGAVYAAGHSYGAATKWDMLAVKYSAAGTFSWAKQYATSGEFDQDAWAFTVNGGVYLGGAEGTATNGNDAVVVRYVP